MTVTAEPFVQYHQRYDLWFEEHRAAYLSELLAIRALLPWRGWGLEIGVGTGRFAQPLGIQFGIDPSSEMLNYAKARSVMTAQGVGEALPFLTATFDYVLIVTTICFAHDVKAMLRESARVLRVGGVLVVGFVDRTSPLGQAYLSQRARNVFYQYATFYSPAEVEILLTETGFSNLEWAQTIFKTLPNVQEIAPVVAGTGRGSFVVVRARSPVERLR